MIEVSDETTLGLFGQTDELVRILRDTLEDLARATVQLRRLAGPPPTIDWCPMLLSAGSDRVPRIRRA